MASKAGQNVIRLFGLLFILAFCLVAARAVQLQVVEAAELQARAEQQRQHSVKLSPRRGGIYDRQGEPLAVSLEVDSLYADPALIDDPAVVAKHLAPLLKRSERDLHRLLKDKSRRFVWLERMLDPELATRIKQLKIPGVAFVPERKRYYPQGATGAHVVGFTGLDPKGLEGLELTYDRFLQGEPELLLSVRDARGRSLSTTSTATAGDSGVHDLYLTLDRSLQYIAEKELERSVRQSKAVGGTAVIMEPASGRILALASWPEFNPNQAGRFPADRRRNRALCDMYEPGSTFKPFLMAAVLEEGIMAPTAKVYCEKGRYSVGGSIVRDHKKFDELTLEEIMKFSSNIGMVKLGKALKRERYYDYLRAFGFGEKTGVDFPGESAGMVRSPARWFEIDLAAMTFGQGLSVTSLQMAAAMSAIANGGLLMTPYLVEKIVDADGHVVRKELPEVRRRVISEKTARQVRKMLIGVTEPGGTGTRAALQGFAVAGKTGTAQKPDPVTGGYSVDKRIASFIGFVPAENPALVIAVTIDEPQGDVYGGIVAAPTFARIAANALNHLHILPREQLVAVQPAAETTEPLPDLAALLPVADRQEGLVMPDFRGMTYRQVLKAMEQRGLNLKLTGSGRVVDQFPTAGKAIPYGQEAWVRFGA